MRNDKLFRIVMFSFGVAVATPVALHFVASVASAGTYLLCSDFTGGPTCKEGGTDDCPQSVGGRG